MSKIHKKSSLRFLSLLLLVVFFLSQFVFMLRPIHVRAQSKNLSPKDYVKLYEAVTFFGVCVQKTGLILNRSNAEVSAFEVFGSRPNSINHQESMGFILENDDGRLKCLSKGDQDIAKNALGLDAKAILLDSGLYKAKPDASGYEVAERDDGTAANKLISYLGGKVGVSVTGDLSKGQQYFALQATFEKLCQKGVDDRGGKEVKTVDDQGNVVTKKYALTDQQDDNYPIGYGIPSPAGQEMNCSDIISRLNDQNNINEAVKEQKAFIAKGGNPGGGTGPGATGAATPTCESINGNVLLSWILCGVVNAIDDAINKIKDSVDGLLDVDQREYEDPNIKAIWAYFKNVASFMLVGVALVIIIGQALNRE